MAGLKNIPIGVDDFKKLRKENYYYVDKTELISDLLSNKAEVYLFTRPRRFGKSLNLSMLDAFLNMKYEGNAWFDGLKISEHQECASMKNAYPVIYLKMKDLSTSSFKLFFADFREMISSAFDEFPYLSKNAEIIGNLRRDYLDTYVKDFDQAKMVLSIAKLCKMLEIHHKIKPIVLIDEYDHPINNAYNKKEYQLILEMLRNFYSATLKSNDSLNFAVITGVMQIAKESIFSGLNNLKVNNIFSVKLDERYGFVEAEVEDLCTYYGQPKKFEEAKDWYDGYRFGAAEIYNPWSLLNYVDSGFVPAAYWAGTSGNDILKTLLDHVDNDTYEELGILGDGGEINKILRPSVAMSDLLNDTSAIYSVMAFTGYLKAVPDGRGGYLLSIPNREMYSVFYQFLAARIHNDAEIYFRNLFDALEDNDVPTIEKTLFSIFAKKVPFILLTDEKSYQLIIAAAAMSRSGRYEIQLENEAGNGRADLIMVHNNPRDPNIVIEFKRLKADEAEDAEKMEHEAEEGIRQIKTKKYYFGLKGDTILYGCCFGGKIAKVVSERLSLQNN